MEWCRNYPKDRAQRCPTCRQVIHYLCRDEKIHLDAEATYFFLVLVAHVLLMAIVGPHRYLDLAVIVSFAAIQSLMFWWRNKTRRRR